MKKQAESWLDAARDDLSVAKEILDDHNLTNMAAFHCQQAVEKSLKALLEEYEGKVPGIHDIITLRARVGNLLEFVVDNDIFDQLNELYVDSRYPSALGLTPVGKPPMDISIKFYELAATVLENVISKLSSSGSSPSQNPLDK